MATAMMAATTYLFFFLLTTSPISMTGMFLLVLVRPSMGKLTCFLKSLARGCGGPEGPVSRWFILCLYCSHAGLW